MNKIKASEALHCKNLVLALKLKVEIVQAMPKMLVVLNLYRNPYSPAKGIIELVIQKIFRNQLFPIKSLDNTTVAMIDLVVGLPKC